MSFHYNMFLIEGSASDLKEKLLTIPKTNDASELARRDRERLERKVRAISKGKCAEEEIPEDLREFTRRHQSEDFFYIWGMDLPGTDFTFGNFSRYRVIPEIYDLIFMFLAHKAEIDNYMTSYFHSGSDTSGNCRYFGCQEPFDIRGYSQGDELRYIEFAKSTEENLGFPIWQLHTHLDSLGPGPIPWTFDVEVPMNGIGGRGLDEFIQNEYFKEVVE